MSEINVSKFKKARIEHKANEEKGHFVQCRTVPEEINYEIHGVHLELCYMIFTRILVDKKNQEETQRRSSSRLSTSFTNSDVPKLFNVKSFLCKKGRVQRNNEERFPVTIATDEAVESFLAAAKAKDPSLYLCSSCWTYMQKNLNGINIAIVISLVASQRVAEISK